MAKVTFDRDASIRCPIYGHTASPLLISLEGYEFFAPFHSCALCARKILGTELQFSQPIATEMAMKLSQIK